MGNLRNPVTCVARTMACSCWSFHSAWSLARFLLAAVAVNDGSGAGGGTLLELLVVLVVVGVVSGWGGAVLAFTLLASSDARR